MPDADPDARKEDAVFTSTKARSAQVGRRPVARRLLSQGGKSSDVRSREGYGVAARQRRYTHASEERLEYETDAQQRRCLALKTIGANERKMSMLFRYLPEADAKSDIARSSARRTMLCRDER